MVYTQKPIVKLAQRIINLIPNVKLFHDLANLYIVKYHNFYNSDIYTNGEYRWLKQAIGQLQNPVVFDVGANIGKWIETVLAIQSSAQIYAFEPSPTTFSKLQQQPFAHSVSLHNLGLGDEKKSLILYEYDNQSAHNSLYPRHDKPFHHQTTVEMDTLVNYCATHHINHINYLKIDTEGNDYHVLVGAKSLLENEQIDIIQFEYGNNYLDARIFLKDIFDLFAPLNYSIYRIMPKSLRHIPTYHESHERFMYSNFTIIHNRLVKDLGLK